MNGYFDYQELWGKNKNVCTETESLWISKLWLCCLLGSIFFFFFLICYPPFEYQPISHFQYSLWLGQFSYRGSILVRLSREAELICVYVCVCIYIYIYTHTYVYVWLRRSTHPKICKLSQQASHPKSWWCHSSPSLRAGKRHCRSLKQSGSRNSLECRAGSDFMFYSVLQLIGWRPCTSGRLVCFTECAYLLSVPGC